MERPKILIIEDEGITGLELKSILERKGFIVPAIHSSGEDALARITETSPDIILMDMRLGGELDGVETARRIRLAYDLPIVFLTAYSEDTTIERAKRIEPYGYILKPFNAAELLSVVEIALYKHKADKEKRLLTEQLQKALDRVKLLSGLLPICCSCKKIRDDKGYWQQLELYIHDHSEAEFSHGICPECFEKLYPEIAKKQSSEDI